MAGDPSASKYIRYRRSTQFLRCVQRLHNITDDAGHIPPPIPVEWKGRGRVSGVRDSTVEGVAYLNGSMAYRASAALLPDAADSSPR